ncbi:methyltransferase domain-containing protein [Pseudoalteromonas obscura]|uniref:tRNA 5-carboxymethoxyuridine methyltransferase n=1 Tax=Pseudoalteromonas obscura TaxID=3048491 RepID=A0ABT7EMX9_9GAMM|nr:methyltransferase domain-containing protein [Pseudoalteromonas sp. P94(2023)]MDK2596383.1 methyltransferase domain-containing protein [Pseudoalteromonas sp. P94(2023)]
MAKKYSTSAPTDRNFCDIAGKFKNNIYGTSKGKIREAVLKRDLDELLDEHFDSKPLRILDAGGGQGQLSLYLAELGHEVILLDVSAQMLAIAKERAEARNISSLSLINAPLQELAELNLGQFDLVLCHAVLEWIVEQKTAVTILNKCLKPDGILSLMYFNKSAQRLANMVYGNFDYVSNGLQVKQKVGLSPNQPLESEHVDSWLAELCLRTLNKTGVRCFHDYLRETNKADEQFDELLALELKYNRAEPYASIGRYTHLLLKPDQ